MEILYFLKNTTFFIWKQQQDRTTKQNHTKHCKLQLNEVNYRFNTIWKFAKYFFIAAVNIWRHNDAHRVVAPIETSGHLVDIQGHSLVRLRQRDSADVTGSQVDLIDLFLVRIHRYNVVVELDICNGNKRRKSTIFSLACYTFKLW